MSAIPQVPTPSLPADMLRLARDQVAVAVDRLRLARVDLEMMDEYPDGPPLTGSATWPPGPWRRPNSA